MTGFADAYDKLCAMPNSDPRFAKAYNMRLLVEEQHALWNNTFYKPARLPESFGTNWSAVTMPQVVGAFSAMTLVQQLQCLTFVREQSSFKVDERLEFLYGLSLSNANLRVRSRAGQCYMDLAGFVNVNNPLAVGLIEEHHATNSVSKKH